MGKTTIPKFDVFLHCGSLSRSSIGKHLVVWTGLMTLASSIESISQ